MEYNTTCSTSNEIYMSLTFPKFVKERDSVPLKQITHDPINIQAATVVSSMTS